MDRNQRPHLVEMLKERSPDLDRIFGGDNYHIEKTGEYPVLLRTRSADFEFTDDPRDFVAAFIHDIPGFQISQSPIDTWLKFLGTETPAQKRSHSYEQQLTNELEYVGTIVAKILADDATTRDAVWFVSGYNKAYNDWASGQGSWASSDDFNP